MTFSTKDHEFMHIALKEAKKALDNGDYPIGAVLVINEELVATHKNSVYSEENWISHAETNIIRDNSSRIKKAIKNDKAKVELYTTLEPCLMCLGSAILHRISRIIYACPDPHGGAKSLDVSKLSDWYNKKWPTIEGNLLKDESYNMLINFMKGKENWQSILKLFLEMNLEN